MKKEQLIGVCRNHILSTDIDVVIKEPYVPFIPDDWNGILVLAESQNLSKTNAGYVDYLKSLTITERFFRLTDPDDLGIQPWDDGSLKLAIQSAFNIRAMGTAVSNSVVWSQVTQEGNNANPSGKLVELSSRFWDELLLLINPKHIVTSGNIAHGVIENVEQGSWKHTKLRLPSPKAMSRVSGMFPEKELLSRYPEVKKVINEHPEFVNGGHRQNKIFFACHAVTIVKANEAQRRCT